MTSGYKTNAYTVTTNASETRYRLQRVLRIAGEHITDGMVIESGTYPEMCKIVDEYRAAGSVVLDW